MAEDSNPLKRTVTFNKFELGTFKKVCELSGIVPSERNLRNMFMGMLAAGAERHVAEDNPSLTPGFTTPTDQEWEAGATILSGGAMLESFSEPQVRWQP